MSASQSHIEHHFTDLLVRLSNITDSSVINTIRRLSAALSDQHSCLRLEDPNLVVRLKQQECVTAIEHSDLTQSIQTPLVLLDVGDYALLYTQRCFQYESRIASDLVARNQWLSEDISCLVPYLSDKDDPLQQMAAIQAMTRQLVVISGGPGTGKTSTVVKCLAGLLSAKPSLNVKLAAPTGKAAMRLSESIAEAASRLPAPAPSQIPTEVTTLHRLLGVRGDGHSFRFSRHNPISADVLILDEASMIDLVMFDRVLDALPASARLIMLGDPAQLPSVDSGSVLADITAQGTCFSQSYKAFIESHCDVSLPAEQGQHLLADAHCELSTSFRFDDQAGIGKLAKSLREDQSLVAENNAEVEFHQNADQALVMHAMGHLYQPYIDLCVSGADTAALITAFDQRRLLTPLREGDMGVTALNDAFEAQFFSDAPGYYHGKPVMIMRNHYALRLFNGDIGICVERGNKVEVAFRAANGEFEYYAPARLPQHESCYAMTVHKSQGSEFDQVQLLVPTMDRDDFLSRELLYTGVTRTKSQLAIYFQGTEPGQLQSFARFSGLRLRFEPGTENLDSLDQQADQDNPDDPEPQLDLFS